MKKIRSSEPWFREPGHEDPTDPHLLNSHGPNVEDLSEQCLLAGLLGKEGIDEILGELEREWKAKLADRGRLHQEDLQEFERRVRSRESRSEVLNGDITAQRERLREKQDWLADLNREVESHQRVRNSLLGTLARRRLAYPVKLIRKRMEHRAKLTGEMATISTGLERTLFEARQEQHRIQQHSRELNKDEYERRSEELRKRRERADEQLIRLDRKLETLQGFGITRKTFGFLIWAGYLSFPVFGWFAGEAIRQSLGPDNALKQLVTLMARAASAATASFGITATLIAAFLLPLALLVAWVVLMFVSDRLVARLDQGWRRSGGRQGSGNMIKAPTTPVRRTDYAQMLARVPLIYAWALIPLGLASLLALAGIDGSDPGDGANLIDLIVARPAEFLFFTFLGATLAVATAAFVMLYSSRVVEPRFTAEGPGSAREALLSNIEIVTLGGLAVLTVVVQGFLGSFAVEELWLLNSPPGVLLLLLLGGFVVAYGLIYKGVFQTRRALAREVQLLDEQIGRYEGSTAIPLDDQEAVEHRQRIRQVEAEIDAAWRQVELYDRPRLNLNAVWRSFGDNGDTPPPTPYRSLDTVLEPELVNHIDELSMHLAAVRGEATSLLGEIQLFQINIDTDRTEFKTLESEIVAAQRQRSAAMERYSHETMQINQIYRDAILRCEIAHQMGLRLRLSASED